MLTLYVLSLYLLEKCSGLIIRQSQILLLLLLLLLLLYFFVVQDCLWFKFYLISFVFGYGVVMSRLLGVV